MKSQIKTKKKKLKSLKKSARRRKKKKIEKRIGLGKPKTQTNEEIRQKVRNLREEVRNFDDDGSIKEVDYHGTFNIGKIAEELRRFIVKNSGKESRVKGMRLITGQRKQFRKGSKIRMIVKTELSSMKKEGLIDGFSFENQSTNKINRGSIIVLFNKKSDDDEKIVSKPKSKPSRNMKREKETMEKEWRGRLLKNRNLEEQKLEKKRVNYLRRQRKKRQKKEEKEEQSNNQFEQSSESKGEDLVVDNGKVNPLDDSFDCTEDLDTMIDFINNI